MACEVFVLVFTTTAGPEPDPSHALAFGMSPKKVLLGDTLMANTRKPSKQAKTQTCDFHWEAVTPNENMFLLRKYNVGIVDIMFEFDRYF